LVQTGEKPATVKVDEDLFMVLPTERGLAEMPGPARKTTPLEAARVLAAHVHSKDQAAGSASGAGSGKLNVILVADLDVLGPIFFRLREVSGEDDEMQYDFDNVTFVLNVLDYLAGDNNFLEIRKRRPAHRTLARIGQATQDARNRAAESAKKVREELKAALETVKADYTKEMEDLKKQLAEKKITGEEYRQIIANKQGDIADTLRDKGEQLQQQQKQKEEQNKRDLKREIRGVQDRYKWWAVVLPPIPPLIVGVVVFALRRVHEREGVSRRRLR
jgi:ABC-2 type transport system permease protein